MTKKFKPSVTRQQRVVMDSSKRFVLACGPRHSAKSWGVLNALANHAYNVKNELGRIAVVKKSANPSLAFDMVFDDLRVILDQWVDGTKGSNAPMKWVTRKGITQYTHTPYMEVSNRFGDVIRIQGIAFREESQVEDMFKNRAYSFVYMPDLERIDNESTFQIIRETVRGIGISDAFLKFYADCLPSKQGTESWIWKFWCGENAHPESEYVQFSLGQNRFINKECKRELKMSYAGDAAEYRRMILGEWK